MKVISIKQPWATLILEGMKEYEFRTWKTKYRGELYIHASKSIDKDDMKRFENSDLRFPLGQIIGKVNLDDCIIITSDFEKELINTNPKIYGPPEGREGYAWKISSPTYIKPIEVNGRLGIWEYKN